MADSVDVENALVGLVALAVMPADYELGSAVESNPGPPVRLYRGWPVRKQLDSDLGAGVVNISVFPRAEEQNTTCYDRQWHRLVGPQHNITATVEGLDVVFGGHVDIANVGLIVNQSPYIYTTLPGDTLASVAQGLAMLVPGSSAFGPVLTLPPTASRVVVRVGGFGTCFKELKRQLRNYQVTLWSPSPALRDTLSPLVDVALATPQWLALPDLTAGRLRYHNSLVDDDTEKAGVYRRDLCYGVEFATTVRTPTPEVVIAQANLTTVPGPSLALEVVT